MLLAQPMLLTVRFVATKASSATLRWLICDGQGNHSTDECDTLKEQAAKLKSGDSNGNGKKKFGNKTWTRKANDATNSSKKELAAFIQKSIKEGVRKELHAIDRKRKVQFDDDNSSVDSSPSVNAFDKKPAAKSTKGKGKDKDLAEILDGDLKDFNCTDMENLNIDDGEKSDGEVTC